MVSNAMLRRFCSAAYQTYIGSEDVAAVEAAAAEQG